MKLTPIFPMSVAPVHVGVYRVEGNVLAYAYWSGLYWGLTMPTIDFCYMFRKDRSRQCYDGTVQGWRGLAKKPE
jgi:hypothetical protein